MLVRDILIDLFTALIEDPNFPNRLSLVLIDRGFYEEYIFVSKTSALQQLVFSLLSDEKRQKNISTLHIQTGCTPAVVPRCSLSVPQALQDCGIDIREPRTCGHIGIHDHDNLITLLSLAASYVKTLTIHSVDPLFPVVEHVCRLTFSLATFVEVPAEMACTPHPFTPFPKAERIKLSFSFFIFNDRSMRLFDFRAMKCLQQAIFGFWDTADSTIVEALLHFRRPSSFQYLAIESDRGNTLPVPLQTLLTWCNGGWLLVLMDPVALGLIVPRWRQFIRYGSLGRRDRIAVHQLMESLITLNNFEGGYEWDALAAQKAKKDALKQRLGFV
ncbi:hypothetical protein VNI00_018779 [Paramarasmius palmivorus]|uniref:Uncharacterized protein n=1 Tax=Paramarasmius palmivorus TaxID=297713 RepID=A0AAW0AVJ0_9AGAR